MLKVITILPRTVAGLWAIAALQMATAPTTLAGPALYYRYSNMRGSQGVCLTKGTAALRQEGLSVQEPAIRTGEAQFSFGENSTFTVIIDCSQVSNRGGRVTVMVSASSNVQAAQALAEALMRRVLN
jgi:hypothetical protein